VGIQAAARYDREQAEGALCNARRII